MYRSTLGAMLIASVFSSGAFAQTAPRFSLVDLGPAQLAGEGLHWQAITPTPNTNIPSAASTQGRDCAGSTTNQVYNEYLGELVGSTCLTTSNSHAAIWTYGQGQPPTLTDLGVLPGAVGSAGTAGPSAAATAANSEEEVVGFSDTQFKLFDSSNKEAQHAFLYHSGIMTDLGAIAGPNYNSVAWSINDSHEIVGTTSTISRIDGSVLSRAFLYTNGTTYNLTFYLVGGPTALLTDALWIDCQGNIAAHGTPAGRSGAPLHSYLLIRQGPARTTCID